MIYWGQGERYSPRENKPERERERAMNNTIVVHIVDGVLTTITASEPVTVHVIDTDSEALISECSIAQTYHVNPTTLEAFQPSSFCEGEKGVQALLRDLADVLDSVKSQAELVEISALVHKYG